jgi:hypothetical protein
VAVACGYGGLVGIDVDTDDAEVIKAVQRVLGEGGAPRRGSKGVCSFYRLAENQPVPLRHFGKLLDLLGHGGSCMIPPSRHYRTGAPYEWLSNATLLNTPLDRLPVVGER